MTSPNYITACQCSQELLHALNSGSDARVRRAVDQIMDLSARETSDTRESEFRDLLAGVVQRMSSTISVEILHHIASDGQTRQPINPLPPELKTPAYVRY